LHYKNFWDDLSIENELIVYDGRIVLPIPSRDRILKVIHSAHQGPDRSLVTARLRYFWPNMAKDITLVCDSCEPCLVHKPSQSKQTMVEQVCKGPFEQLATDVFTLNGRKFLIVVDRFSNFPWVMPISGESTAVIVKQLDHLFFTCCFTPKALRHDGATAFTSTEFADFLLENDIIDQRSSAHYPQSNSLSENTGVKQVKLLLKKHDGVFNQKFKNALNILRTTPTLHIKTKKPIGSPVQRLFMMTHHLPGLPSLPQVYEPVDWKTISQQKRDAMRARKDYFDMNARELKPLKPGQYVAIQDPISKLWDRFGYVIKSRTASGRSYHVKEEKHGRVFERNRRLLRPADLFMHIPEKA